MPPEQESQPSLAPILPQSHMGADGPWLLIAVPGNPIVRLDVRCLDFIEVDDQGALLLDVEDLAIQIGVSDGMAATQSLVRQLSPYTRGVPIENEVVYEDARRRIEQLLAEASEGLEQSRSRSHLKVGEITVTTRDDLVVFGDVAFRVSQVEEYASHGASLPLTDGLLQAAIALVVVAIKDRQIAEDLLVLAKRISDYESLPRGQR